MEVVALWASQERVERVLALEGGEMAMLWCMDRGNFINVRWGKLVNHLMSFKAKPPAVCLAVLRDVKPVPFLGHEETLECMKTLQVLTRHHSFEAEFHASMVSTIAVHGAIEVLVTHLSCPVYERRMTSTTCLTQMGRRLNGRQAIFRGRCQEGLRAPEVLCQRSS